MKGEEGGPARRLARLETAIGFAGRIHVVDIGAAAIAEPPPYLVLLDRGLARLSAVDGDDRQSTRMRAAFGPDAQLFALVLADGTRRPLHIAALESGMTSLLRPSPRHLDFFNGFAAIGAVEKVVEVQTMRLADVAGLQQIDFLKMDIQGAELMVLENSGDALDPCVAIQLEASFVPLYENQPVFGDIDRWMRGRGFLPHCFVDVKCWSISPVIRDEDFRRPFNQLLECDIVYVRDPVALDRLADDALRKLALIAGYAYRSPDLAIRAVLELERRGSVPAGTGTRLPQCEPFAQAAS
jgi:FkbM family methyltransferase